MRSFIYLDEYKLYSFSSQLFRGLVDHIVRVSDRSREQRDEARPASGIAEVVAEIASEGTTVAEKRFLHDYAYDLFEGELRKANALHEVGEDTSLSDFVEPRFLKVTGPAIFADAPSLRRTIDSFNEMGEALAYLGSFARLQEAKNQMAQQIAQIQDRNMKAVAKENLKKISPRQLAEQAGLRQDEELIKRLSFLLELGYGDQFHVQVPYAASQDLLFTAVLGRSSLRESERSLLEKYSRMTDRSVVMVGIPTQSGGATAILKHEEESLRAAMSNMVGSMSELESQFTGRMKNEVIVDPIAIYVEWSVSGSATETT